MKIDSATAGLEALEVEECRRLLGAGGIGRIAIAGEGAPILRPVNFAVKDGIVVIRTGEGRIFDAARRGASVAFEIDNVDGFEHEGWSVIATGRLSERDADAEAYALPLRPWSAGRRDRFVMIELDVVSGRRIALEEVE